MTDQQSAVEAMARAQFDAFDCYTFSFDDAPSRLKKSWMDDAEVALTAFLSHLTASGWQIVPVVATDEMCRAWENSTNEGASFEGKNDEEVNNIIARTDYATMLAAAPQFPGRDG